jgi:hypothetical protein
MYAWHPAHPQYRYQVLWTALLLHHCSCTLFVPPASPRAFIIHGVSVIGPCKEQQVLLYSVHVYMSVTHISKVALIYNRCTQL